MNRPTKDAAIMDRSPGKKQRRKRAAKVLAAAGAIAGGTQAYAAPVRFDNPPHGEPGHFHWAKPNGDNSNLLDITAPADAQPGEPDEFTATALGHVYTGIWGIVFNGLEPIELETTGIFLAGVASGELIPGGHEWRCCPYTYYAGFGYESFLPEGAQTYLGVRFDTGAGWQYAWVGVVRTGQQVEAFAWGYESDPGVPIAAGAEGGGGESIPTVSEWGLAIMSLSLLAAGTWVLRKPVPRTGRPPA